MLKKTINNNLDKKNISQDRTFQRINGHWSLPDFFRTIKYSEGMKKVIKWKEQELK